MISLTRLNGERIALNPELIERAEETPDTVLTLVNGTKYLVHESLDDVIERVKTHRASILALSRQLSVEVNSEPGARLHLLQGAGHDHDDYQPPDHDGHDHGHDHDDPHPSRPGEAGR
jgi:flagellar protein FlbD